MGGWDVLEEVELLWSVVEREGRPSAGGWKENLEIEIFGGFVYF